MVTQVKGSVAEDYPIYVGSVAELEALSLPVGTAVYLTEDGRAGSGTIKAGAHTADPQKGIFIDLANGNYWERHVYGEIMASWFGLLSNGSSPSTNDTVLQAIRDFLDTYSASEMPSVVWPSGDIAYTVSPNWERSGIKTYGQGSGLTKFTYSGTGKAWIIDPSSVDVSFRYGMDHSGFLIDCGANATHGVYEENIAHSSYKDIFVINGSSTCIHWENSLTVLNTYTDCGSPINRFPVTSFPQECLRLSASPSKGSASTANTYRNWIAEGATLAGVRIFDGDVNTFIGGTSESNSGRGVIVNVGCRNNTFQNFDMEANNLQDFDDAGNGTIWDNCLATSLAGSNVSASSILCKIRGGYYDSLTIGGGATNASVESININVKGTGGFTDNGTATTKKNIYDLTAGSFIYSKGARGGITVGASPFTYTNSTSQLQQVLVRGGTVSLVTWGRSGDSVLFGGGAEGANPNDQFLLAPGDTLTVTYSAAPSMNFIPMGVQSF